MDPFRDPINNKSSLSRVAFVGNYLPRQCGIATFTTDLCESIAAQFPGIDCFALAVNDSEDGYAYPSRVRFELAENDIASYRRAADFLNINNVDLLCLQHEYGIFGGPAGSHILALLREVRMPVITTLHTILREPNSDQRATLEEIAQVSDRVVVMSRQGAAFLRDVYSVPNEKIDVIPHGIPDVPFVDPNFYKDQFGVEGKMVLLTFGLLSPNKGIETVIKALPDILSGHPNVVYIVVGATHPHVQQRDGETYRLALERLAEVCGVERNVIFHNRFVGLAELNEFIGAADIYLTPYLNPAQIVSGTLAYAVGAGKAVVSTPYWYAEEMLADGCGAVVPFGDCEGVAGQVIRLLDCEPERHAMRKRAYLRGREMVWQKVALRYFDSFRQARNERLKRPRRAYVAKTLKERPADLPLLKLDHLRRLTDDTGILQHAIFTVPNYNEGYTTDDNARALLVSVALDDLGESPALAQALTSRYLAFVWHAFEPTTGRFRNMLRYDRRWSDQTGSEDCHGRTLWGLARVIDRSSQKELRELAVRLFGLALSATWGFSSPRAWSFALLGISGYLRRFPGDRAAQNTGQTLTEKLIALFKACGNSEWPWFEDALTYSNATLAHALLVAGKALGRDDAVEIGLKSLSWLAAVQRSEKGHFVPVGSNGFYRCGGERARFDQQPIEANAMVAASIAAWRITGDDQWRSEASRAFEWFLGRNDLGIPLYDPATGGCCDGLHPDRANQNQGAESTVAFLDSLLEMRLAENITAAGRTNGRAIPMGRVFSAASTQPDPHG